MTVAWDYENIKFTEVVKLVKFETLMKSITKIGVKTKLKLYCPTSGGAHHINKVDRYLCDVNEIEILEVQGTKQGKEIVDKEIMTHIVWDVCEAITKSKSVLAIVVSKDGDFKKTLEFLRMKSASVLLLVDKPALTSKKYMNSVVPVMDFKQFVDDVGTQQVMKSRYTIENTKQVRKYDNTKGLIYSWVSDGGNLVFKPTEKWDPQLKCYKPIDYAEPNLVPHQTVKMHEKSKQTKIVEFDGYESDKTPKISNFSPNQTRLKEYESKLEYAEKQSQFDDAQDIPNMIGKEYDGDIVEGQFDDANE